MPMNLKDQDGKQMTIKPVAPAAKCMFACFGCGTPFTFRIKATSDDEFMFVDNTFCFCMHPSPCPCLPCCGCGPCAQAPKFKRDSADPNKWVGTGDSLFAGGFCKGMMHNKGDVILWGEGKNSAMSLDQPSEFHPGNSPAYPPCLQGVHMANAFFTDGLKKGGAPDAQAMER